MKKRTRPRDEPAYSASLPRTVTTSPFARDSISTEAPSLPARAAEGEDGGEDEEGDTEDGRAEAGHAEVEVGGFRVAELPAFLEEEADLRPGGDEEGPRGPREPR